VDTVRAEFHTFAALDAFAFVAPDAVFGQGVSKPAGGTHRFPGGGAPGFILFNF
jgi:hypothetical protein